jgi:hypothetical protein
MEFVDPGAATYINVLLFGPPKTGKTTGAATAPGAVLYFNVDLPNATGYAHQRDTEGRVMEPRIAPPQQGKAPVFDLMTEIAIAAHQKPTRDTVVVDPLGELYRRLLEEQTNRTRRPTLDQRGNATTDVERWCRAMCEAPVNFVIVAHEMTADKGEEGLISMPFTGSKSGSQSGLGPKIMGMVDVIGFTAAVDVEGKDEPEYVAQLVPGKGRQAGSRFSALMAGPGYRPIDLAEWFAVAKGEKVEQREAVAA